MIFINNKLGEEMVGNTKNDNIKNNNNSTEETPPEYDKNIEKKLLDSDVLNLGTHNYNIRVVSEDGSDKDVKTAGTINTEGYKCYQKGKREEAYKKFNEALKFNERRYENERRDSISISSIYNNLGVCEFAGRGVKPNRESGYKKLKQSLKKGGVGVNTAKMNIATCNCFGVGDSKDPEKNKKVGFEKLKQISEENIDSIKNKEDKKNAEIRKNNAIANMARCYLYGIGTEPDLKKAEECLNLLSSNEKKAELLNAIGNHYYKMERDAVTAKKYFKQAMDMGSKKGEYNYNLIQGKEVEKPKENDGEDIKIDDNIKRVKPKPTPKPTPPDPRPALHNQLNKTLGKETDAAICKDGKFYKKDGKTEIPLEKSKASGLNNVDNGINSLTAALDKKIEALGPNPSLEQVKECEQCINATNLVISNAQKLGASKSNFDSKVSEAQTAIDKKKTQAKTNYDNFTKNCENLQKEAEDEVKKDKETIVFKNEDEKKAADKEIEILEAENKKLMEDAQKINQEFNKNIEGTENDNKTLSTNVNNEINGLKSPENPTVNGITNYSDNISNTNKKVQEAKKNISKGDNVPEYENINKKMMENQLRIERLRKGIQKYEDIDRRPDLLNEFNEQITGKKTDAKKYDEKTGKFTNGKGEEVSLGQFTDNRVSNIASDVNNINNQILSDIKKSGKNPTEKQLTDFRKRFEAAKTLQSNVRELGNSVDDLDNRHKIANENLDEQKKQNDKNYEDFENKLQESQRKAQENAVAVEIKNKEEKEEYKKKLKELKAKRQAIIDEQERKKKEQDNKIDAAKKNNNKILNGTKNKVKGTKLNGESIEANSEIVTNLTGKVKSTKFKTADKNPDLQNPTFELKSKDASIEDLDQRIANIEAGLNFDRRPDLLNEFNKQITGKETDAKKYDEETGKFTNDKGEEVKLGQFGEDRLQEISEGVNNINNQILADIKKNGKEPSQTDLDRFRKTFKNARTLQNNVVKLADSKENFDKKYNEANNKLENNITTINQNLQDFENTTSNVTVTEKELKESEYKEENDVSKMNERLKEIEEEEKKLKEEAKRESESAIKTNSDLKELNNGINSTVNGLVNETNKDFNENKPTPKDITRLSEKTGNLAKGIDETTNELISEGPVPNLEEKKNKLIELEKEKQKINSRVSEVKELNELSVKSFNLRQKALGAGGQMAAKYDPVNKVYLNEKGEPIELTDIKANSLSDKFNKTTNKLLKEDYDLLKSHNKDKLEECDRRSKQVANITRLIDETDKSRENFLKRVNESIDKVDEAEKDKKNKVNELDNYYKELDVTAKEKEETGYEHLNTEKEIEEEKKRLTKEYEQKYEEALEKQRKYLEERIKTANDKADNVNDGVDEDGKTRDNKLSTLENNIKNVKKEYDREIDDFELPDQEEYKKQMKQLAKREYQLTLNLDKEIDYLSKIDPNNEEQLTEANKKIEEKCEKIYEANTEEGAPSLTDEEKRNIKYEEAQKSIDKLSPENQKKCAENGLKIMDLSPETPVDLVFLEKQRIYACKIKDCNGKTATNYKDAGNGVKMENLSSEYLMNVGNVSIGLHSKVKDVSVEDFYKGKGNPPEDKDNYNYSRLTVESMFEDKENKHVGYTIDLKYSKGQDSVELKDTISKKGLENCGAEFVIKDRDGNVLNEEETREFLSKLQPKPDTPERANWRKERKEIVKRENTKNKRESKSESKSSSNSGSKKDDEKKNEEEQSAIDRIIAFIDSLFNDKKEIEKTEKQKENEKKEKTLEDRLKEKKKEIDQKIKEEGYGFGERRAAIKKVKEEGAKKYNEMAEKEKEKEREKFRDKFIGELPNIEGDKNKKESKSEESKQETEKKEAGPEPKKEENKIGVGAPAAKPKSVEPEPTKTITRQELEKDEPKRQDEPKPETKKQEEKRAKDDFIIKPTISADKTDPLLPPEKQDTQNKINNLKKEGQSMSTEMRQVQQAISKSGLNRGDVASVGDKNEKTGPNAGTTMDVRDKSQSANKTV